MNSLMDLVVSSILPCLFGLSIKGSVIVLVVLLIQRLGRSWLSGRVRYWLWLPPVISLVVPFGIDIPWSPFSPSIGPTISAGSAGVSPAASAGSISATGYLTALWGVCAFFLLVVVAFNTFRFQRLRAGAVPTDRACSELFDACVRALHIRRRVRVLESREVNTPVVIGWLCPQVLLPSGLALQLDPEGLRHVFLHELAHVKRNDIALNWLVTAVQILHWFNPLVWYGLHRMRRDREIACDAHVLRHLPRTEHRAYAYTLISLLEPYPRAIQFSQGLRIVGSTNHIKERVQMIKQFRTFRKRHVIAGGACLVLVALLAFSESRTQAQETSAEHNGSATEQDVLFTVVTPATDSAGEIALTSVDVTPNTSEDVLLTVSGQDAEVSETVQLTVVTTEVSGAKE